MMPYIKTKRRTDFDQQIKELVSHINTVGELNYVITQICHRFIIWRKLCYHILNNVIGVLECAKLELYRMVAAPYEDVKRKDNGPISELDE